MVGLGAFFRSPESRDKSHIARLDGEPGNGQSSQEGKDLLRLLNARVHVRRGARFIRYRQGRSSRSPQHPPF